MYQYSAFQSAKANYDIYNQPKDEFTTEFVVQTKNYTESCVVNVGDVAVLKTDTEKFALPIKFIDSDVLYFLIPDDEVIFSYPDVFRFEQLKHYGFFTDMNNPNWFRKVIGEVGNLSLTNRLEYLLKIEKKDTNAVTDEHYFAPDFYYEFSLSIVETNNVEELKLEGKFRTLHELIDQVNKVLNLIVKLT